MQINFVDALGDLAVVVHDVSTATTLKGLVDDAVPGFTADAAKEGWLTTNTSFYIAGTTKEATLDALKRYSRVTVLVVLDGIGDTAEEGRELVEAVRGEMTRPYITNGSTLALPLQGDPTVMKAKNVPLDLSALHGLLSGAVVAKYGMSPDAVLRSNERGTNRRSRWLLDAFRRNYIKLVFSSMDKETLLLPRNCTVPDRAFIMNEWRRIRHDASIEHIGRSAFSNAQNLRVVHLSSLKSLGMAAFWHCMHLTEVDFRGSSLEVIPHSAFYGCVALKIVRTNEALKSVMGHAFAESGLRTISLKRVTLIGLNAFRFTNIVEATLSAKTVPKNAFKECDHLKVVTLIGTEKIEEDAFASSGVCAVLGLEHVRVIESGAFAFSGIKSVIVSGVVKPLAFESCMRLREVEVRNGTLMPRSFANCVALEKIEGGEYNPPRYLGVINGHGNWLWRDSPFWNCYNALAWQSKIVYRSAKRITDNSAKKVCAAAMGIGIDHIAIRTIFSFIETKALYKKAPTILELVAEKYEGSPNRIYG